MFIANRGVVRSGLAVVLAALCAQSALGAASGQSVPEATDRTERPAAFAPIRIGTSTQGRAITAYRIGDNRSTRKRVIIGQIHGDEKAGYQGVNYLLTGARRSKIDLYVVPTVNPDGLARGTRQNARGVDLNRNFPVRWAYVEKPGGKHYQGAKPLSEVESRVIRDFLQRIRPHEVVIIHQPLDGVDVLEAKNTPFVTRLVRETGLPRKAFACWGVCRGTVQQWYNATRAGSLVTVELPKAPTTTQIRSVTLGIVRAMMPVD